MIAIFLADGFEEIEALTPLDVLRRAGADVKTVGISGKIAEGTHGIKVVCDMEASELNPKLLTMAIFPGGLPGATNLDASEAVSEAIDAVLEKGGRLAAICAAPLVLGHRGLLKGKKAVCYPGFEKEMNGAYPQDADVVTDGSITTAIGMGASLDFALELVRLTCGKEKAEELSAKLEKPVGNARIISET